MGSDLCKFVEVFAKGIAKLASGNNKADNKPAAAAKNAPFKVDNSDKKDWYVSGAADKQKDNLNGFHAKEEEIPEAIHDNLLAVGGKGSDLSDVWVQDNGENKVTYGFKDAAGNNIWVRYELGEDGQAREVKRTVQSADGTTHSTGTELNKDKGMEVAIKDLKGALGNNVAAADVTVQDMGNNTFVYSAKDENGKTTYIKYENKNGEFKEIKRTVERTNGEFATTELNNSSQRLETSVYTIGPDGKQNVTSTYIHSKDGKQIYCVNGKVPIDPGAMDKLQYRLGADYDFTTTTAVKDADGSTTYNVKSKDGRDAWIRFDANGVETARTIETVDDEFSSFYSENDRNGQAGAVTTVSTTYVNGQVQNVEQASISNKNHTYKSIVDIQSDLHKIMDMALERYGALEDMPEELQEGIACIQQALNQNDGQGMPEEDLLEMIETVIRENL